MRTPTRLATIVAQNPFPDGNPSLVTVAFLTTAAPAEAKRRVAEIATDHSRTSSPARRCMCTTPRARAVQAVGEVLRHHRVSATVRNLRTVTKVLELAERDE